MRVSVFPTITEFCNFSGSLDLVPVWIDFVSDIFTPICVWRTLNLKYKNFPSYLLESVERDERIARFSFVGAGEVVSVAISREDPLRKIKEVMSSFKIMPMDANYPFEAGMVGYISYDMVRFFEPIDLDFQTDIPEAMFFLPKIQVCFDHHNHRVRFIWWVDKKDKKKGESCRQLYSRISDKLIKIVLSCVNRVSNIDPIDLSSIGSVGAIWKDVKSNFSKRSFCKAISKAKYHIHDGDIIQVVLSQRFEVRGESDPFNVYRMLRLLNPSPYMFLIRFPKYDLSLVGASPEMLVKVKDGIVESHPIAGTRPRGKDVKEDLALAEELLSDEKERAEHVMLVDLSRNDLGRVCEIGSVRTEDFMHIERFSHVMHIVSRVVGRLRDDKDCFDVVRNTFPAGTVSGAPKIRAMELIRDIEKGPRGIYAGAVGYFDFSGNMDMCIAIRTIVFYNNRSLVQAGAGIVADSDEEKEYLETRNKAKAQVLAVKLSQGLFKKREV